MAKYYCYFGDQVKGPISCEIIRNALSRGEITEDMMIRGENADEWVPLGKVLGAVYAEAQKQGQNQCADNLLTVCVFVFFSMAIAQIVFGFVYLDDNHNEIGIALIFSSLGYIFPIAIAYAVRQMFRNQLRGND